MRVIVMDLNQRGLRTVEPLQDVNWAVDHLTGVADAVELAQVATIDLMIIEASEGGTAAIVRRVRRAGVKAPLLVRLEREDGQLAVSVLDEGADDCIWHDASQEEVRSRALALVRRNKGLAESIIDLGAFRLDLVRKHVTVGGSHLSLTGKEYAVLEALSLRLGHVLNREVLTDLLYDGYEEPAPKIVDVFICKLRRKLRAAAGVRDIIHTERGRGYLIPGPARIAA